MKMATNTKNLNLKKPAQTDFYNIEDFNENFQKLDDFAGRKDNPHGVTAEQVGAFPASGGTLNGDMSMYHQNLPTFRIGSDYSNVAMFRYTENKTFDMHNITKGQPTSLSLGNVNSMLLRDVLKLWVVDKDYKIYGDHNAEEVGITKIASGTYAGTGTFGADNPNTLTFPFIPKVVLIALTSHSKMRVDMTLPIVYGSEYGLVCCVGSVNWTSHTLQPINLVWDDKTLSWSYTLDNDSTKTFRQLNHEGYTYTWVAIG